MTRINISVDGPASSGKGTVARMVARALDYAYVDTGAMYRTVALLSHEAGVDWSDADALAGLAADIDFRFRWDGEDLRILDGDRDVSDAIRSELIGRGASDVSVHPEVREALLELQRRLGRHGGVVMDGRDIGTVVLPEAELKIYLDASARERARRRLAEFRGRGIQTTFEAVLEDIERRDHQDSTRATAPLRAADDAVVIDSTPLTAEEVARIVLELARARLDEGSAKR